MNIDKAVDHYASEGAIDAALGFVDAIEKTFAQVGRHPAAGSTRYAEDLNLPGLRSWALVSYPYVVSYRDCGDHIDVWRVLHGRLDILVRMSDSPPV